MYRRTKDGDYCKVLTIDGTYVLRNDYTEAIDAFEKKYDMTRYRIDHMKHSDMSSFIREGTHFNCTIFLKDSEMETEHIDMPKAYSQLKKCSAYAGFWVKSQTFVDVIKLKLYVCIGLGILQGYPIGW